MHGQDILPSLERCDMKTSGATFSPANLSPLYEVHVNGQPRTVRACRVSDNLDANGNLVPMEERQKEKARAAAFCSFNLPEPVEVAIKVKGCTLRSALVRPLRMGIAPKIDGNTLRFRLDRPCKLSVEPNGSLAEPLFLFAGGPPPACPSPDAPGVRYFGPGEHALGLHHLSSGETLFLDEDAVVYGQIRGQCVEHVRIVGRGILDLGRAPGQYDNPKCNEYGICGCGLSFSGCRDIVIEGVHIIDAPGWTIQLIHCDNIRIADTRIITWRGNGDGIDLCSCENSIVEDCFLRTFDDALVIKGLTDLCYPAANGKFLPDGKRKNARNLIFRDCVIWLDIAHAVEIGLETRCPEISDILFQRMDIIHCLHISALDIESGDSATIRNVVFEDISIEDARCQKLIRVCTKPTYTTADECRGPIRDVVFRRVQVHGPCPPSWINGENERASVSEVSFDNVRINGVMVRDEGSLGLLVEGAVDGVRFRC